MVVIYALLFMFASLCEFLAAWLKEWAGARLKQPLTPRDPPDQDGTSQEVR